MAVLPLPSSVVKERLITDGRVDAARRIGKQRRITLGHVATAGGIKNKRLITVGCVFKNQWDPH